MHRLTLPIVLAPCLLAAPLQAAIFDAAQGKINISTAAFSWSLDSADELAEDVPFSVYSGNQQRLRAIAVDNAFVGDAIEGRNAFRFGGKTVFASLELAALQQRFQGRRVELSLWQKPMGTRANAALVWYSGDTTTLSQSSTSQVQLLGTLALRPTGTVSSDGWQEWSSGPFDYVAAGHIAPFELALYDLQYLTVWRSNPAAFDDQAAVLLDGLEIRDLGPAAVPLSSCRIVDEDTLCGEHGACLYGQCVDAAIAIGPLPFDDAASRDYLQRRVVELRLLEGGRLPRSRIDALEAHLQAPGTISSARQFWSSLQDAVEQLGDGHARSALGSFTPTTSLGACVHLGDADMLEGAATLPLVFSIEASNPVTELLHEGDVLVSIDGLEPMQWARLAQRLLRHGADSASYEVMIAPQLLDAALRVGAAVRFARCQHPADGAVCTQQELKFIDISLADVVGAALWGLQPVDWLSAGIRCDYRFRRALTPVAVRSYAFAGAADHDGVRTLLINGVPSAERSLGGEEWSRVVREAMTDAPPMFILDQRRGDGGFLDSVDLLVTPFLSPQDVFAVELLPPLEGEADAQLQHPFENCTETAGRNPACGLYQRWVVGDLHRPATARGTYSGRLAVLNSADISGNDFVSKLLSFRTQSTRFFAPCPTAGAFGAVVALPKHYEEAYGGNIQITDARFQSIDGDVVGDFSTGIGVVPDERVLQRQSDAVRGVDTIVERAKAWLQQESP